MVPGLRETEPCEHRNEDPSAQNHREAPSVPRPQAQPEVETDAAMNPRDQEQHRLAEARPGIHHPEREEQTCIGVLNAEEGIGEAGAHHVGGQQRGHGETEENLGRLPDRHAKGAPTVDEPEAEQPVHDQRAVERDGAERIAPEGEEPFPSARHGVERDQTEGVVGEVGEQIKVEDEAAAEPERPDPCATRPLRRHLVAIRPATARSAPRPCRESSAARG